MYVAVMAGGSGTRFWPASRKGQPKQFLNITGKGPMVLETCERVAPIAGDEEIILVLGAEHLDSARTLFEGRPVHMVAEPVGRNTAACVGLGAVTAQHLGCEGPVAFLPADHFIGDVPAFLQALSAAGELAASGAMVMLGIVPTSPETGYGYIRHGQEGVGPGGAPAYPVLGFTEKPAPERAQEYLSSGDYLWNAGIFVATPERILQEMERHLPDLHAGLMKLKTVMGSGLFTAELDRLYATLPAVSFDVGIMEQTRQSVYVIPCACGWSDVGTWKSLYDLREPEHDEAGNLADGEALLIDCRNTFVSGRGNRLVACLGLKNCLVVETADSILVADLNRAQDVRKVVAQLERRPRTDDP